ncbi:MAG: hypothetical protein ABSE05_06110 [Syntrophales bacterium]|jgi:hypothetical protein
MRGLNVISAKLIISLFICFAVLSGCTPAIKSTQWTCFYQEQDKECQNLYDESFTKVLDGSIVSIDFVAKEFQGSLTADKLYRAVKADGYNISVNAPENTLEYLNGILKIPNFFDKVLEKKEIFMYTPEIKEIVHLTSRYRSKNFQNLSEDEQNNIKRLNRLVIESLYAQEAPKAKYVIAVRTKLFCNDEEKETYMEGRKKRSLPNKGYENLKYSIFELDIDCIKRQYRFQGQFDYDDKDMKLDGQAFPFSGWMKIDAHMETIFQRECNPGSSSKKVK